MTILVSMTCQILSLPVYFLCFLYEVNLFSFVTVSRILAMIPGKIGILWRREWYSRTLKKCGPRLEVEWMAAIRSPHTEIGSHVTIGTFSWIGWANLGDDVLIAGHVTVLSGNTHHGFERKGVPIRLQNGNLRQVNIGKDSWIGQGAIIMADVADGSVVGAGSVVTKTFQPFSVIANVPARVLRLR